jgi:hypothetical protein
MRFSAIVPFLPIFQRAYLPGAASSKIKHSGRQHIFLAFSAVKSLPHELKSFLASADIEAERAKIDGSTDTRQPGLDRGNLREHV